MSGPLVQYVCHHHITSEVMLFITCNQHMGLLNKLTKQRTFTPFAIHGIVDKVNNNALLAQTVLY